MDRKKSKITLSVLRTSLGGPIEPCLPNLGSCAGVVWLVTRAVHGFLASYILTLVVFIPYHRCLFLAHKFSGLSAHLCPQTAEGQKKQGRGSRSIQDFMRVLGS